ncbi:hypothetical protein TWF506_002971 [Arthrobotrys conoides]|uniref:Cell surface protein n=1 Tax=Arthrobotrys conoides TaxID=74498 RepID=A0AAN8RQW3_9PEZI
MSNVINKVKDALSGGHKDKDHDTHTSTTGTSTTSSTNPNYYGTGSTNAGPHNTNVGNKVDPRVDSDRDGSSTLGTGNTYGSSTTGTHGTHGMAGMTGTTGTGTYGTSTGGHGPHSSGMANRADPFVDSTTGSTTRTGGMGTTGYSGSTNAGPHNSNVANKLDPRVDSDRDGSYAAGTGTGNTYGSSTTTGTGMTGSSGYNSNKTTAGPHKSDMANKLDPRVDSDLDGSRTVGSGPKYGNY